MKLSYLLISSLLLASISFTSASHRANLDTTHDIYFDDIRVDNAFYAEDVKTSSVHTTKLGTHETRIVALLTEQIMNPESDFIKVPDLLRYNYLARRNPPY